MTNVIACKELGNVSQGLILLPGVNQCQFQHPVERVGISLKKQQLMDIGVYLFSPANSKRVFVVEFTVSLTDQSLCPPSVSLGLPVPWCLPAECWESHEILVASLVLHSAALTFLVSLSLPFVIALCWVVPNTEFRGYKNASFIVTNLSDSTGLVSQETNFSSH